MPAALMFNLVQVYKRAYDGEHTVEYGYVRMDDGKRVRVKEMRAVDNRIVYETGDPSSRSSSYSSHPSPTKIGAASKGAKKETNEEIETKKKNKKKQKKKEAAVPKESADDGVKKRDKSKPSSSRDKRVVRRRPGLTRANRPRRGGP